MDVPPGARLIVRDGQRRRDALNRRRQEAQTGHGFDHPLEAPAHVEPAGHVGFAEVEMRVDQQAEDDACVADDERTGRRFGSGIVRTAVGELEPHGGGGDPVLEDAGQPPLDCAYASPHKTGRYNDETKIPNSNSQLPIGWDLSGSWKLVIWELTVIWLECESRTRASGLASGQSADYRDRAGATCTARSRCSCSRGRRAAAAGCRAVSCSPRRPSPSTRPAARRGGSFSRWAAETVRFPGGSRATA